MVHLAGLINSYVEVEKASGNPIDETPDNLWKHGSLYIMVDIIELRAPCVLLRVNLMTGKDGKGH